MLKNEYAQKWAARGYHSVEMPFMQPVRIDSEELSWLKKTIKYFERRRWTITEDYYLFVPHLNETLFIPEGFIFDCASVPRFLWPVINPTGILLLGSLFHDFGYVYNCFLNKDLEVVHGEEKNARKFFDNQIRDINIHVNDYNFMNKVAWQALRLFAWLPWQRSRKRNAQIGNLLNELRNEKN